MAMTEEEKKAILLKLIDQICTTQPPPVVSGRNAKTPTLTALPPILTGEVTACNVPGRYINLRLAQPVFDFSSAIATININGISSECVIPSDNLTVLSCTLPQPLTFPINIAILINGSPAGSFTFDGSYCGYKDPSVPNNDDQQPNNPQPNVPVLPPNPNDPNNPNNPPAGGTGP